MADADLFLDRVKAPDQKTQPPLSPWPGILLTIGAPLAAIVVGYSLLMAINIGKKSAAYSTPRYFSVRAALTQEVDRDLTAPRLGEVLSKTDDASPFVAPAKATPADIEKGKAARLTARTADLTNVAARLNGDRAQLAEALTALAMTPPLAAQPLKTRLTDGSAKTLVNDAIKNWVSTALDPWTTAALTRSVKGGVATVATAIHDSLGLNEPFLSLDAAMTPRFDAFTLKTGDSWWTNDVGARLTWAVVTLVFLMAFAMATFTSVSQVLKIGGRWRGPLIVFTALAAVGAGALAYRFLSPGGDSTPLHRALNDYARMMSVQIVAWSSVVNVLRAVGLVLLIAGSLATFAVKIASIDELTDQLRGFKAMFNAGTIFLLAGVLEVYALLRWPVVFAADEPTRGVLNGAAANFAASIGVLFTVVLLATYIVTTIIVRQQAIRNLPGQVPAIDEALTKFGFSDLLSQQGLRLAQALLPLLPGFINVFM